MDDLQIGSVNDHTFFDQVTRSPRPVVMMVGAEWCADTKRAWRNVIPVVVERYCNVPLRFIVAMVEGLERGKVVSPAIKKFLRVEEYPTLFAL